MTSRAQPQRILLVANRTCPCHEVHDLLVEHGAADAHVVIVAPALNGRLAHAVSDTDGAFREARERLDVAVGHLRDRGIEAEGIVGDSNPLVAIDDVLAQFAADEIVISSWPPGRSNWLEKNLVDNAREDFGIPVHHVVSHFGLPATEAAALA
jgi:GABA permease